METERHMGALVGRKALERKCHRVEAVSAEQEEHSGKLEQHARNMSKWVRKPSVPQVLQVIQKGWRVGTAGR